MRAAGAPSDIIEAATAATASPSSAEFEVWPENWQTLEIFLDLSSCWTWLSAGLITPIRIGIAATEIEATLRLHGLRGKRRRNRYQEIRLMEAAALEVLRK